MEPKDIQAEFYRVWDSHNLKSTRMQELIGTVAYAAVSAAAHTLCEKIDDLIANGMNRCTSHEERLKDLEATIALLDHGSHPTCQMGKARWEDTRDQLKSIKHLVWGFVASVVTGSAAIIVTLLITRFNGVIKP